MTRRTFAIVGIALVTVLAVTWSALAQTGALDVPWFSVDGGGGTSAGGNFTLDGTIGQPDAGKLAGGDFAVEGGFIPGVAVPPVVADTCGDVNGDGVINVFDAITELQIIVGLIVPTETQLTLGDVVRDGTINVFDAILVLQHIVGLTVITECGPRPPPTPTPTPTQTPTPTPPPPPPPPPPPSPPPTPTPTPYLIGGGEDGAQILRGPAGEGFGRRRLEDGVEQY